jgi:flagellar basal body-associated protein FliL
MVLGLMGLIMIIGLVLLLVTLAIVGIFLAKNTTKKEKRERVRISREAEKIDELLASGKISADEAQELKETIGVNRIIGSGSSGPDKHIRVTGIFHMVYGGFLFLIFLILVLGCFFPFVLAKRSTQPSNSSQIRRSSAHFKHVQVVDAAQGNVQIQAPIVRPNIQIKKSNTPQNIASYFVLPVVLLILFLSYVWIRIIAGYKLMKGKRWARVAIIIFSVLDITNVPLGAALGIYSLWVLIFRDYAGDYFIEE